MSDKVILMVEDDALLRTLIASALGDLGFAVVTAHDGVAALDILAAQPIDILFSDISMPNGVSGIELARRAAESHPDIRILLASGFARGQLPDLPPQVAFLPKPYRIPQLLEMLAA